MTFPIKGSCWLGYGFWQKTYYSPHHLGRDYHSNNNNPIVAHLKSVVKAIGWNGEIGNYIVLQDKNLKYVRHLHLDRVDVYTGQTVNEGQQIGLMGNTGKMWNPTTKKYVTYSIHDHADCWHNYPDVGKIKRTWDKTLLINPDDYFKEQAMAKLKNKTVIQTRGATRLAILSSIQEQIDHVSANPEVLEGFGKRVFVDERKVAQAIYLTNARLASLIDPKGTVEVAPWVKEIEELKNRPSEEMSLDNYTDFDLWNELEKRFNIK